MTDPVAITGIVLAIASALGGLFGYFHLKLKSNCCGCCLLECREKSKNSPPNSPLPIPPKEEEIRIKGDTLTSESHI